MEPLYIVGAGGIGCAVGYALLAAKLRPIFVEANSDKVSWGRRHGVGVVNLHERLLPAEFVEFENWAPSADSLILLCTKCYDNDAVLARVPAGATLVPIQNGFDPRLYEHVSTEGIASFVSECRPGETRTRITRSGCLHLGVRQCGTANITALTVAHRLAEWLRKAPFAVSVVADIAPFKYTKLLYNAAISPLAAAAGIDNGQLLSLPHARRLFFALLKENYDILAGAGVKLETIGPFHPRTVRRILDHAWLARGLAWAFTPSLRGTYCSMAGDVATGRTEVDYYNRHLISLAGAIPCPLNRAVYDLLKRLECERTPPSLALLERLDVVNASTEAAQAWLFGTHPHESTNFHL